MLKTQRGARHPTSRSRLAGASLITLALAWPVTARAQAAPGSAPSQAGNIQTADRPSVGPSAEDNADVIVTGSRTITNGADAPTPVTVVSAAQLQAAAPTGTADALNQLPVLQNSLRPTSTGSSATGAAGNGANLLSLRGLGSSRTLVLLDGRRLTPSNANGSTDVNLIPQALLARVDIVTGGASAAYGSDAVAGVVNFVLDTKFTGLKGEAQGGISTYGDNASGKFGLTFGKGFAGDRAHVLLSVDGYHGDGVGLDYHGRQWAEAGWGLIPTGGTPSNTFAQNVRFSTATYGGLITSGPLANQMFLPGGTLAPFTVGTFRSATVMSGGDGAAGRTNLVPALTTKTAFGYAEYELSSAAKLFGSVGYGNVKTAYPAITAGRQQGSEAYTIFIDNAFLPDAVRTRMEQLGITQFPLGRFDRDWGPVNIDTRTETWDFTGGLNGAIGGGWRYSGYYEHGRTVSEVYTAGNPYFDHMYRAADAVRDPATGQIVCRTSLANPNEGCVPINLFGDGAPSAAAIAYVTGTAYSHLVNTQDVVAADLRGPLFQLPGGPLQVAFGGEYRRDQAHQRVDAVSASRKAANGVRGFPTSAVGGLGGFQQSNPQPLDGAFSVKEAFAELDAPLLKDVTLVHALSVNAAIRYAHYSTAGGATTYKIGVSYSPFADLRLRATQSRDIRAPNLAELFTGSQQTNGVGARDPLFNNATSVVVQQTTGNTDLVPEKANTFTGGLVYEPSWLPGASVSADFYKIDISRVITPLSVQQVVDGCQAGNAALCDFITRNAPVGTAAVGTINTVRTPTFNLDARKTQGVDIEASYRTHVSTGQIGVRVLATYIDKLITVTAGVPVNRAGEVGGVALAGAPHWQGVGSLTYDEDRFGILGQVRFIGGGKFDNTLTPALLSPELNRIEAVAYVDVSVRYRFNLAGVGLEAYGTVNNLLNREPPITPNGAVTTPRSANGNRYDFVGRYLTAGLRFRF